MNHLKRFSQQLSIWLLAAMLVPAISAGACFYVLSEILSLQTWLALGLSVVCFTILVIILYGVVSKISLDPLEKIWQAVWHVSPGSQEVAAPNLDNIRTGRELVASMARQIYDLAGNVKPVRSLALVDESVLDTIPVAIILIGKDRIIKSTNHYASALLGVDKNELVGKNMYDGLRLSFTTDDTLDTWLNQASSSKIIDQKSWEHVRQTLADGKTVKQFDLSASFSKDEGSGNELALVLFDKTESYQKTDQSTDYVAMAVHELRTPLTLLRGYIEVFEDELGSQLNPELSEFMRKMNASAQTLTAFVSNILNVARIDENQLVLSLREADWPTVLGEIVDDLRLRAGVRGKTIELEISPDLPKVAIDRISIYEVVSNLVDNAIKHSGQSAKITVKSQLGEDGSIKTEVQDFGTGIPGNVIGNLFTRYYRSHRSSNVIGGSGLGLYLVKSIITAHGGQVWVQSKEGMGSTFGFSVQSYEHAKQQADDVGADGIERHASGWIKNHSLYRR